MSLAACDAAGRIVALAQYATCTGEAELGVVVGDDWRHVGLGGRMVEMLAEHARRSGVGVLSGVTFACNRAMCALAARLGFSLAPDADPELVRLERPLDSRRIDEAQASIM